MVKLAQSAGSVSTIFNIEQGNLVPGPEIRLALAAALGVSVADIWPTLDQNTTTPVGNVVTNTDL